MRRLLAERYVRYGFTVCAWMILMTTALNAQKNDTIYLMNGDRITGELKKLEYGLVFLKTDALETVTIEYDMIATMHSAKNFEYRTTSGYRYYGSVMKSATKGTINIVTKEDTIPKPLWDIVQITSIKNLFLQKIDGSIDMGLSFTKASDVFQYSLKSTVTHRTANYATRFDLNSILSEEDNIWSKNNDVSLNVTRYLPEKWFVRAETRGQQNTELNLQYRIQAGAGGGYDIVRSNSQRLYGLVALLGNREETIDSAGISTNLECLFSVAWKWFRYRQPKLDISSSLNFYPSLTIAKRYRMEYDISSKIEIIKDVFLNLTLYENFDNAVTGTASKNDWGIITSIGYTF
jgi:hypothetical protein